MAIQTKKVEVPDHKYKHQEKNQELEIYREQHPVDPRSMDQNGIMTCSHKRYNLGDHQFNSSNFNSFSDYRNYLEEEKNAWIILPVYLMDHTIQTVKTTPFNGPHAKWDSGQVGYIYTTKQRLKDLGHDVDDLEKDQVKQWLKDEVERYSRYLRGEVYRFELKEDGEVIDRCGGLDSEDYVDLAFEAAGLEKNLFEEIEV